MFDANVLSANESSSYGAIRVSSGNGVISNNVIEDAVGAGIYIYSSDATTIANNTIVDSSTYGLRITSVPTSVVVNNIIYSSGGYDVYNDSSSAYSYVTFTNNNVYGGTYGYRSGYDRTGYQDNISQDPQFTDAANGDYSLVWGSNCIAHGTDVSTYGVTTDLDGADRDQGLGVDLGAVESY